jgi:hypothetical protein
MGEAQTAGRLFALDGVLQAADGILNLAFDLVGLALRRQFGVTDRLADRFFDLPFDDFRRANDPILVRDSFPSRDMNYQYVKDRRNCATPN